MPVFATRGSINKIGTGKDLFSVSDPCPKLGEALSYLNLEFRFSITMLVFTVYCFYYGIGTVSRKEGVKSKLMGINVS
jgi:hypothetical protein